MHPPRPPHPHPIRSVLAAAIKTLALAHVAWSYGGSVLPGRGPSMLPTFAAAEEYYVADRRYRRGGNGNGNGGDSGGGSGGGRGLRVGDCVLYAIPVEPSAGAVKRVVGMPGDYVLRHSPGGARDGGGAEEAGDADGESGGRGSGSGNASMIQVPRGHVYVVGDNLPWSRDSRDFGPLPMALIRGKIVAHAELNGWNPLRWFTRVENALTAPPPPSGSPPGPGPPGPPGPGSPPLPGPSPSSSPASGD
ncbi:peptidase S24/S26A/S26B/S26C [Xylariaceae sp. FL0804]|nr:peptidase S24/S26A/S26B/S26C [Xylariaceae sp. FL0804]